MARYQYKREPLTNENADRLANAARSGIEKVVISTPLDTGLRVSELAGLTKENVLWQDRRLLVYGKDCKRRGRSVQFLAVNSVQATRSF